MGGSDWLVLVLLLCCGLITVKCEEDCPDYSIDCSTLLSGQFLCIDKDIDPDTQQLRGCHIVNGSGLAKQKCTAIPGIVCQSSCNNTFFKEVPCKFTNGYNFDTALLVSVFLGMFGVDRFYLGYPAMGLLKFSTLGFFFIGHLVDIILIATQTLGPADGSHYVINYFGAALTRVDVTEDTFRICGRNKEVSLGPGLPPLSSLVTRLESHGHHKDSLDLITALVTDITARLTLETSVILIDCSHKFNIKKLSRLLGDRVRKQAEEESKRMKEAGLSREEREKSRMTSYKQWEAVRNALSRLFILHVHTPDCLETSILNLNDIITANYNVSAVIVLGVNTFYHQLHKEESINYFNYTKRMRSLIEESCSDYKDSVKILMVELNIFGDKTDSEDQIAAKKPSMVIVENSSNGLSVHFQGRSAAISLDNNNMITWN